MCAGSRSAPIAAAAPLSSGSGSRGHAARREQVKLDVARSEADDAEAGVDTNVNVTLKEDQAREATLWPPSAASDSVAWGVFCRGAVGSHGGGLRHRRCRCCGRTGRCHRALWTAPHWCGTAAAGTTGAPARSSPRPRARPGWGVAFARFKRRVRSSPLDFFRPRAASELDDRLLH